MKIKHLKYTVACVAAVAMAVGASCKSDDNSALVLVDVDVDGSAPEPTNVTIDVLNSGGTVATGTWAWSEAVAGVLRVGLYVAGDVGTVTVQARGQAGDGTSLQSNPSNAVAITPGATTQAVQVTLIVFGNLGGSGGGGGGAGGQAGVAATGGSGGAGVGGMAGMATGGAAGMATGGMAGMATGGMAGMATGGMATGGAAPPPPSKLSACKEYNHWKDCVPGGEGDWPLPGLAVAPDGVTIVTGGGDGSVRSWRLAAAGLMPESGPVYYGPNAVVDVSPDGKIVAVGDRDGKVNLLQMPSLSLLAPLGTISGGLELLKFIPGTDYLISASYNGEIRVWKVSTRASFNTIQFGNTLNALVLGPPSAAGVQMVAAAPAPADDGSFALFDVLAMTPPMKTVQASTAAEILALDWVPSANKLAVGMDWASATANTGMVKIYDMTELMKPVQIGADLVPAQINREGDPLAFHPGGNHVAVGWQGFNAGADLYIYDLPERKLHASGFVPEYLYYKMKFARGGATLVSTELRCKILVCEM